MSVITPKVLALISNEFSDSSSRSTAMTTAARSIIDLARRLADTGGGYEIRRANLEELENCVENLAVLEDGTDVLLGVLTALVDADDVDDENGVADAIARAREALGRHHVEG
jgi:hypothetical protein